MYRSIGMVDGTGKWAWPSCPLGVAWAGVGGPRERIRVGGAWEEVGGNGRGQSGQGHGRGIGHG